MAAIELVHDVLDMQLVDRNDAKMGRVDGVTIELREGAPPRVAELLIGGTVLADRVGGWAARLVQLAMRVARARPHVTRIPFEVVEEIGDVLKLDVEAQATGAFRTEQWLDRIVCGIPGGDAQKKKSEGGGE